MRCLQGIRVPGEWPAARCELEDDGHEVHVAHDARTRRTPHGGLVERRWIVGMPGDSSGPRLELVP